MLPAANLDALRSSGRSITVARPDDANLGPLSLLPGTWKNIPSLPDRGWNMIALPFATSRGNKFPFNYSLLFNQYNEELPFRLVDAGVRNRGIRRSGTSSVEAEQILAALD